ncbi:MAG: hypothetical protein IJ745_01035, partial [Bacteroidales bacterium]|nr:hypothetical protein [Bacteroidales bacterium]
YRLPVPPEDIHSLMGSASLFVCDSQTMTSEAAVLGVPALKCNSFAGRLSVPNMLQDTYGLCHAFSPEGFEEMLSLIRSLLSRPSESLRAEWLARRSRLLQDCIDPIPFFIEYISHYEGIS